MLTLLWIHISMMQIQNQGKQMQGTLHAHFKNTWSTFSDSLYFSLTGHIF